MRVVVTGGRNYADQVHLEEVLDCMRITELAQGGASGADALAERWAKSRGVKVVRYSADWKAYGKGAGPIRNRRMLEEFLPDLVLAFPGGAGTANCTRQARELGISVLVV